MKVWSVDYITAPGVLPAQQDADLPDELLSILEELEGVTGVTTGGQGDLAVSARFCVEAPGPAEAFAAGLEAFQTALGKLGIYTETLAGEVEDFNRLVAMQDGTWPASA